MSSAYVGVSGQKRRRLQGSSYADSSNMTQSTLGARQIVRAMTPPGTNPLLISPSLSSTASGRSQAPPSSASVRHG